MLQFLFLHFGPLITEGSELTEASLSETVLQVLPPLCRALSEAGVVIEPQNFRLDIRTAPHRAPSGLPRDSMAVYSFFQAGECLKVGIVGPKSQARYVSQHYSPASASSTLGGSICRNPAAVGLDVLDVGNVGAWMRENLCRADLIVPASYGMKVLRFAEAFLHLRWNPRFEGRS